MSLTPGRILPAARCHLILENVLSAAEVYRDCKRLQKVTHERLTYTQLFAGIEVTIPSSSERSRLAGDDSAWLSFKTWH